VPSQLPDHQPAAAAPGVQPIDLAVLALRGQGLRHDEVAQRLGMGPLEAARAARRARELLRPSRLPAGEPA
jgi:hypothetical protein